MESIQYELENELKTAQEKAKNDFATNNLASATFKFSDCLQNCLQTQKIDGNQCNILIFKLRFF